MRPLPRRAAAAPANKQQGFLLPELLLAVALSLLLVAGAAAAQQALLKQYYKQQVRIAAQQLASDLRQLQQRSQLRFEKGTRSLRVINTKLEQYTFYTDLKPQRTVTFSELGCEQVYFAKRFSKVYFNNAGTPILSASFNDTYELRHRQLADFGCSLAFQPVTGRITLSEIQ